MSQCFRSRRPRRRNRKIESVFAISLVIATVLVTLEAVVLYSLNHLKETLTKGVFTPKSIIAISNCYFVTAIIE